MTTRVRHRRALTPGGALPNLPMEQGELALNIPDRQLFMGGSGGTPAPMIGVRVWAATAVYAANDMVSNGGVLFTAKVANGPSAAFNPANWTVIGGTGAFLPLIGGTITGDLQVNGFLKIGGGNAATPGLTFVADPDTGFYWYGENTLGFSTAGLSRMILDANGTLALAPTSNPGAPNLSMICAAGGFGLDIRGRASDNLSVIRLLKSDYTGQLFAIQCDDNNAIIGTTAPIALNVYTGNVNRVIIGPQGGINIGAPGAAVDTLYVKAASGMFGMTVEGALGAAARIQFHDPQVRLWSIGSALGDMFTIRDTSRGVHLLSFNNVGGMNIAQPAGANIHVINGDLQINNSVTVASGNIFAPNFYIGSTANSAGTFGVQGANGPSMVFWGNTAPGVGQIDFIAGGNRQAVVLPLAGAANSLTLSGATSGNRVQIGVNGTDGSIGMQFVTKGVGDYAFFGNGGVQFQVTSQLNASHWIQLSGSTVDPLLTVNGGRLNIGAPTIFSSGSAPPANNVAGQAYTYHFATSVGFVRGDRPANDRIHEFYYDTTGFYGRFLTDAYGAPASWLQVLGSSGGSTAINMFAYSGLSISSSGSSNGLNVIDTGGAGANIKLSGNGATTPNKYIRASGGWFEILSSDYSRAILRISDAGVMTTGSGLSGVVEPGASSAAIPIGGVVIADSSGASINALTGTLNAATNNLTLRATNSGANPPAVNYGMWRNCGAISSSSSYALWIRTS